MICRRCYCWLVLFAVIGDAVIGRDNVVAADNSPLPASAKIQVNPTHIQLIGKGSRYSLLIDGVTATQRRVDVTRQAEFLSHEPAIAEVSPNGVVIAHADGQTSIFIKVDEKSLEIPVTVTGTEKRKPYHFENDVIPLFSKFGCNSGGCHGKAEGQNGFKLSVFGFDPEADYAALVSEGRGRRLFPPDPSQSLLLQKACGDMPHGGGVRIRKASPEYRTLRNWIAEGMPVGDPAAPHVVELILTPKERQMTFAAAQQLRAVAVYSDGTQVDVTNHASYQSNSDVLARVDEFGLVTAGDVPGEVALMASYMGAVDVFRVLLPQVVGDTELPSRPVYNFIDTLVDAKLGKLNIAAAEVCSDEEFLRRAFLDVIGTLPTANEAREFLADSTPDKRQMLVNGLLARPEYADYWSLKWADLLRVDREKLGHKAAYSYYRWIRDSFGGNKPFDQFATELISAEGLLEDAPAGHAFKVLNQPGMAASAISQVFLGVRIECAQCHHHPFDRWSQTDYFGMQAFFTQVGFKSTPQGEMLAAVKDAPTKHPRTGAEIYAHPLGTSNPDVSPTGDRRNALAAWLTSADNAWFARNIVNRYWAHFLGRGLVEPVDDFRSTNPPTNPELLDGLSQHFVSQGFDVHDLIRTITSSRTYQLSAQPNASNEADEQNFSRALFRQLDAEVLFDAVCQTTGVAEKFQGVPAGYRAIQLWDSQVPHYFLKLFGRPVRATACECERAAEPSVGQVLHILNSPEIQSKLSHAGGRLSQLVERLSDDSALVEELYLTFYSRFPSPSERRHAADYLAQHQTDRRQAAEDLAWSLMNSVEFLFNH